jgi:hypothetical protein
MPRACPHRTRWIGYSPTTMAGSNVRFGTIDGAGRPATFTGDRCMEWAGGRTGRHHACQGNILVGEKLVTQMSAAFEKNEGAWWAGSFAGEYNLEGKLRDDDLIYESLVREIRDITPETESQGPIPSGAWPVVR